MTSVVFNFQGRGRKTMRTTKPGTETWVTKGPLCWPEAARPKNKQQCQNFWDLGNFSTWIQEQISESCRSSFINDDLGVEGDTAWRRKSIMGSCCWFLSVEDGQVFPGGQSCSLRQTLCAPQSSCSQGRLMLFNLSIHLPECVALRVWSKSPLTVMQLLRQG